MRPSVVSAVGCLVATLAVTAAGQNPQQTPPTPTFTAAVDLVRLDVSVLDRNRQPVRNLQTAEFTLLEDGKPQSIEYFKHIDLPEGPPEPPGWMRDVSPDVAKNEDISERRLVVILMDDAMIPFDVQMTTSAKRIARDVVDRLGPNDLAAVVFTRDNRPTQNFTRDRARLLAAISGFESAGFEPRPGAEKAIDPLPTRAIEALYQTVTTLAGLPDRRKALVYVSTGIPIVIDTPDTTRSEQPYWNWLMRRAIERAQQGSVNIYAVDPGGLDGLLGYMLRHNNRTESWLIDQINQAATIYRDFLRDTADDTGGHAFTNSNEFTSRIDQLFRETGSFYMLGYRPQNPRADGRFHRLQVKVKQSDLTVNVRRGYYAPPAPTAKSMTVPPVVGAIAGLVPKTDLPLELIAAPFGQPGHQEAAVVFALGVRPPRPSGDDSPAGENVEVLFGAFTPEGDLRGSTPIVATVPRASRGAGDGAFSVLGRLDLRPGRYELRASASIASISKSGSVYGYLDVPDFSREPVSLSGLVISATPATASANVLAITDLLRVMPTTRRTFASSDDVASFVRVYQGGMEAATPVSLAVRIVDRTGRAIVDEHVTLEASQFAPTRSADFSWKLPLDRLGPGAHLLTIEASRGGAVVKRDVRFGVR
jgi:VWFA-related protein